MVDRLVWAAPTSYRVGDVLVGVRTDTIDGDRLLRRILHRHVVAGEAGVAYYSVRLGTSDRGLRPHQELYQGHCQVARGRGGSRVIAALLSGLSDLADDGLSSRPRINALGLARNGAAVMLPARLRAHLPALEPRLARIGVRVIDAVQVTLQPGTGEVVVPERRLEVDEGAVARLSRTASGRPDPVAGEGRYRVAGWVAAAPTTRAAMLASAMRLVTNLDRLPPHVALHTLAASLRPARLVDDGGTASVPELLGMIDELLPA